MEEPDPASTPRRRSQSNRRGAWLLSIVVVVNLSFSLVGGYFTFSDGFSAQLAQTYAYEDLKKLGVIDAEKEQEELGEYLQENPDYMIEIYWARNAVDRLMLVSVAGVIMALVNGLLLFLLLALASQPVTEQESAASS